MQTVYADVLVILNTYVNFALLRLTALTDRKKAGRLRVFLAALSGGVYSLIILVEDTPGVLIFLSKVAISVIMILIAFGSMPLRGFLRTFAVFFGVSFIFAGLMFALWVFAAPEGMIFNNGTVYFRFDTMTLLVLTAVSYALVRLIFLFAEKKTASGKICEIEIEICGETIKCSGLCDSGSSLRDWYTSKPVILISPSLTRRIPESFFENETNTRYIPAVTAGGETMIRIFRADGIHIKTGSAQIENPEAYIGISNNEINNGEFKAVIPHAIIEEANEKCSKS